MLGTVKKHSTLSVIHTTNFNAARKNYMYQKELPYMDVVFHSRTW